MKRNFFSPLYWLIVLMLVTGTATAQKDIADSAILLLHKTKGKVFMIKENQRVIYKIIGDQEKHYGKAEDMTDSSVCFSGKCYDLNDLALIGPNSLGLIFAKAGGGLIMIAGSGVTYLGVRMLTEMKDADPVAVVFIVIIGAVVTIVGLAAVAVGSIPLLLRQSRYDLTKKFSIQTSSKLSKKDLKKLQKEKR